MEDTAPLTETRRKILLEINDIVLKEKGFTELLEEIAFGILERE